MIRINLLGRARPKATRQAVPLEATLQIVFMAAALLLSFGVLYFHWHSMNSEAVEVQAHIRKQMGEKARLEHIKSQVDEFSRQRTVLQQRISIIEELQRNRVGGQALLDAVANTVSRTDTLWLTSLDRKGDSLTLVGEAGSINAVANFITQLKHSGYFDQVEIKESTEYQKSTGRVETFAFTLTAQFTLPPQGAAVPEATPTSATPAAKPAAPSEGIGGPMAISFKEMPWYLQALAFVGMAVVLLAAGEYVPGLPVAKARTSLEELRKQDTQLNQEVSALQVYERRYAEFQQEMTALNKQLDTLKAIVPDEKATDEFLLLMEGAASASGVQIRKVTAEPVVSKDYHFDMPFSISVDGPYYSVVDFFSRLSRLSRIINVGDLAFSGLSGGKTAGYAVRPTTSVSGACTVTTFFTTSAAPPPPSAKPGARPAPAAKK